MRMNGGAITLTQSCSIRNGAAAYGGAISIAAGSVTVTIDCVIESCFARLYGGALLVSTGTAVVANGSVITNSEAGTAGGAVALFGNGDAYLLHNSSIVNSTARVRHSRSNRAKSMPFAPWY